MQEILTNKLFQNDSPENPQYSSYLVRAMSAIAMFSKAFKQATPEAIGPFKETLDLEIQALNLLPINEEIRAKVTLFLHRMIESMQRDIFPFLPGALSRMMEVNPSPQSLTSLVRLVNQLISRFKSEIFDLIDTILVKLIQYLFEFYKQIDDLSDQKELQRFYFLFLQSIVLNNMSDVFFTDRNRNNIMQIYTTIIEGCLGNSTDSLKNIKVCFTILNEICTTWPSKIDSFDQLVPSIADACLKFQFGSNYDMREGETIQVLVVVSRIQRRLCPKYAQVFIQKMQSIPALNEEIIKTFLHNCTTMKQNQFTKFLKEMITHYQQFLSK